MDIVERLRKNENFDTWNGFVSKEAADEIELLRSVLMMWVKFFDEDGEEDIFAAEEAMEATRQVLNMGDEDGV